MKRYALGLLLIIGLISHSFAMTSYDKYWSVATITGPISPNKKLKYYLEPQIRLIDTRYVFNQLLLIGGFGYAMNKDMVFFMGPGLIISKSPRGVETHERRFWQQLNWLWFDKPSMNMNSRTRLEEREDSKVDGVAYRLRQRLWIRFPFKRHEDFAISCYDEIFLNANHPRWVSPHLFEQNRAFLGLGVRISKTTMIDVGYLNQYLHGYRNERGDVVLLSFLMNF